MKTGKKRSIGGWLGAAAVVLMLASTAQAAEGISLMASRIEAKDVAALAKFYEKAFGLKEVQRIQTPTFLEIMLNFGDTVEAAKASSATQVVIMQRASDDVKKDAMPQLIFGVKDMKAAVAAFTAAGGKMDAEPKEFGKTGILIGMAHDPAGNPIEFIQQPKR
jgi:predicted enzyme related to lactoylglutathione lyase